MLHPGGLGGVHTQVFTKLHYLVGVKRSSDSNNDEVRVCLTIGYG